MAANQTTNNNSIRSILEKEKLNGSNFLDWYRNLRIVLRNEQKLHHLEEALPEAPPATATAAVRNAYTRRVAEQQEVACLMLVSMTPEIQKNLEDRPAFEILQELKTMFQQQAEQELFETVKAFHACKQEEGKSVSTYMLKMKAYLDQMEIGLCYPILGKTIPELHAMLKLAEKDIPKKTLVVLAIRQVFEMFKTFQNEVENQLEKTIKALRLDRGGEYLSQEFLDHLRSRGIISQLTPPYMSQHNGVLEKRNRTLLDMVQSMMSLTTFPVSFWGYALESVACILNMVPTKKVNKTPYEMWHEKVPNLSYLKVWGCEALVKRDTPNKLESRSIKCIFVGYPKETMGYYFYYPLENKIFVARYVELFETNLIKQEASGSTVDFDEILREDA
ncbi:retrotransposon protein, putative, ty1-copia subclass [Tanacetum coccineum]|uniref:Retrotransposon protein, putative, ty1-copia subclass n=1 Tax=Tanacetum coccineum TaxID=301880 RepID=A0ABQ4WSM0_9ASTR